MKILFVVDTIQPLAGAPAVRIHSFASQFAQPPAQVLGGAASVGLATNPNLHLVARPKVDRGMAFAFSWLWFVHRMRRKLIRLARQESFDAIVISVPQFELLACADAARSRCSVLVVDIRDSLSFVDYGRHLGRIMPAFLANRLARVARSFSRRRLVRALDLADRITVANDAILGELKPWAQKTCVVSNGVDTARFRPVPNRGRVPGAPLELVYMGNFAEKDRFDWLLQVLPEFDAAVRINLIGDGRERAAIVQKLGLRGIPLRDLGSIPHEKIPETLRMMDAGVLLRDAYAEASIPVAFYEFASMNLPTICNEVGIAADFVRVNGTGYVVTSPEELARVLRKLVTDRSGLDAFNNLHEKVAESFSRAAQAQKLACCLGLALQKSMRSQVAP